MPVLEVALVAPLADVGDALADVREDMHAGRGIRAESEVQPFQRFEGVGVVLRHLRQGGDGLVVVDEPFEPADEALAEDGPPIRVVAVVLDLPDLLRGEVDVVLVRRMDPDAVGPRLDVVHDPEAVGRVVVQEDQPAGTDEQLAGGLVVDMLALVQEQPVAGGAVDLAGIVGGEELQDRSVSEGVRLRRLVPARFLPDALGLQHRLEVADCAALQVRH